MTKLWKFKLAFLYNFARLQDMISLEEKLKSCLRVRTSCS